MSNVIELHAFRNTKEFDLNKSINENIFSLEQAWYEHSKAKSLARFIKSCLPISSEQFQNLSNSLDEVSALEISLGIFLTIIPPEKRLGRSGWKCEFEFESQKIETPEFSKEIFARIFAVLLFLRIKRASNLFVTKK